MFRTLVVIHLYYPQLWKELLECVWSIDGEKDVLVTYGDESAVAEARRDLPAARFLRCENRGFDVWPFLFALPQVKLSDYALVVKLHTKRDIDFGYDFKFNGYHFNSIDVLCVPSFDEPSGLTVIEGTMYGKPVVTTDQTGANYMVDGSSGRIVRAGDVEGFASALRELAVADLAAMGEAARRRYLELGTVARERRDVLAMLADNAGKAPLPVAPLRFDDERRIFRIARNRAGQVKYSLFGVRVLKVKGAGIRRRG